MSLREMQRLVLAAILMRNCFCSRRLVKHSWPNSILVVYRNASVLSSVHCLAIHIHYGYYEVCQGGAGLADKTQFQKQITHRYEKSSHPRTNLTTDPSTAPPTHHPTDTRTTRRTHSLTIYYSGSSSRSTRTAVPISVVQQHEFMCGPFVHSSRT